MNRVVIIGGGIAGLSTAYELHRRNVPFLVFDAQSRPGGVILTERLDGFVIDGGPDALLVHKPAAIELCGELGLAERLVPTREPRTAYVLRGGRLHPLPEASVLGIPTKLAPLARSRLFSVAGKARMGLDLVVPARTDGRDESIGSFMGRRFGREAVEYLAEPLLAGIHAGDVDRLSIGALFPRLVEAEQRHGSLIRAFRRQRAPQPAEGAFRSLTGGLGALVDALVATLPAGAVRLGARACRVDPPPATGLAYHVHLQNREPVEADAVVLATPAYATATLVASFDPGLADLCAQVPYASTATIALGYDRRAIAHPLDGSGFVVPRREASTILAATWVSSKWPARAPDGCALLRAFAGGARDPGAFDRSDDELVAGAERDLGRILGIAGRPLLSRVYRWPRASPQHVVGHLERVARIERALEQWPGLFVTGSGFRGTGIPDCVADGRAVAARAAEHVRAS